MSTNNSDNLTCFRPAPPGQDSDSSFCIGSGKAVNRSAVPRRPSSKDMYTSTANLEYDTDGDMIAPMGFEPEGCATKPSFCEGNSSLLELLSDRQGYALFREYLHLQKQEPLLDFWQSCEEFKRLASTGSNLATPRANSTYNNYMHSKHLCARILKDGIRVKVKHKLGSGQPLNESLFDQAKDNILSYMNYFHYARFIGSDVYKRFDVSKALQCKDRVTAKQFNRFASKGLPPLPEEKVFEENAAPWTAYDVNKRSMGRAADEDREGYVPQNLNVPKAALAGMFRQPAPPAASADQSDVQSLSSDALTDETKSTVTDFSDLTAKSTEKHIQCGPRFQDITGFVPRTMRQPKAKKQLPPDEFAKILIEKLEKVAIERDQEDRAAINLASLPNEHGRENKKSILEDAKERHHQFQQQAGRMNFVLPPHNQSCYSVHSSTMPAPFGHPGYMEQQGITSYYPALEPVDNSNPAWHGCEPEHFLEKQQCLRLVNTRKQWESVGTIESAPDSGVSIEENLSMPPDNYNRIHQWLEHSEKEVQQHLQQGNYTKTTRTKQAFNSGLPASIGHGSMHLQPVAQDPLMPPLAPPDSRNTIEEASRRLSQKSMREKRGKSHKNRTGYLSSKSSQGTCPQLIGGDTNDCSSSIISGDYQPGAMYSSSSVLSTVPSTVNSMDSGLGGAQKNKRAPQGTKVVYYLDGEKYPYQSILPEKVIILGQLKELIHFRKGNYRFFFKTETDLEDCKAVWEEIWDDDAIVPCYGDKIICQVKESKHV